MNAIGAEKQEESAVLERERVGGGGYGLNMLPTLVDHDRLRWGDAARIEMADNLPSRRVRDSNQGVGVPNGKTSDQREIKASRQSTAWDAPCPIECSSKRDVVNRAYSSPHRERIIAAQDVNEVELMTVPVKEKGELDVSARPNGRDPQASNLNRLAGDGHCKIRAVNIVVEQEREGHLIETTLGDVPQEVDDINRKAVDCRS